MKMVEVSGGLGWAVGSELWSPEQFQNHDLQPNCVKAQ